MFRSYTLKWCRMYKLQGADTLMEVGDDTVVYFEYDKDKKEITKVYVGKGCEDDRFKKELAPNQEHQ